jgi:nitroreductase
VNDSVAAAIRARRTTKDFTGEALPRATIEQLLDLANQAPTHRLTQPWRFYALDQAAIARLATYLQAEPAIAAVPDPAKGAAKLAKLLERLPTLGAMVLVTWVRDPAPAIDLEDHAAASAAVQNLLLAATSAGIGSFWSTNPALSHPLTARWCGADPAAETTLAAIWLGRSAKIPEVPPRKPLTERMRWV